MTNEEIADVLSYDIAQEYDSKEIVGYHCALEMAAWKEKQMVEKAFGAMREIYETYGYIPENCKEEFEQIIRRNHE